MYFFLFLLLHFSCLYSLPVIDSMKGQATVHYGDKQMILEAEDNAIVRFSSFDIEQGETLTITTQDPSHRVFLKTTNPVGIEVNGKLLSNGNLYLLDHENIHFSQGSEVEAFSLTIASAYFNEKDFLLKNEFFWCPDGRVDIRGSLLAHHQISLIAKDITQQGNLCSHGNVTFAMMPEVSLNAQNTSNNNQLLPSKMRSKQDALNISKAKQEVGFCKIEGNFIFVHSGKTVGKNIYIYGKIRSKIVIDGNLWANCFQEGEKGGEISIQGNEIYIERTDMQCCGPAGGGEVFIGGGDRHHSFFIPFYLSLTNSEISCCAIDQGNGGRVAIRTQKISSTGTKIFVRPGLQGGQEGIIETIIGDY